MQLIYGNAGGKAGRVVSTQSSRRVSFRLTFGVAVAMAMTSSRASDERLFSRSFVDAAGLADAGARAAYGATRRPPSRLDSERAILAGRGRGMLSYLGAVIWMYERRLLGKAVVVGIAGCAAVAIALPLGFGFHRNLLAIGRECQRRLTAGRLQPPCCSATGI